MCVGSRLMARPAEKTAGLLGIKEGWIQAADFPKSELVQRTLWAHSVQSGFICAKGARVLLLCSKGGKSSQLLFTGQNINVFEARVHGWAQDVLTKSTPPTLTVRTERQQINEENIQRLLKYVLLQKCACVEARHATVSLLMLDVTLNLQHQPLIFCVAFLSEQLWVSPSHWCIKKWIPDWQIWQSNNFS